MQGNPFLLIPHRRLVSTELALGPSRATSPAPLLRDGDLIPFSMTIAFLASCVDRCIPRPEMVLLLISVVLVPLVGEFGP